jgi:hypothetical protein
MSHPSTTDQTTTTAPSSGGWMKKCVVLGTKCKLDKAPADQVIIELAPYHGSRNPLDLIVVEHIFWRRFCHTQFLRPKLDAHRMYAQDQVVIHTVRM